MTPCEHCGRETPDEAFCTWCGAHRIEAAGNPRQRHHHFAAHPGEHVAQPSVVTTLFPHLPVNRIHEFRWALLSGLAVVVILVSTGLVVASILAAAVLVPVLYLVYLYEAQVYRDEPAPVLAFTMVAGVVLGVAVTLIANHIINPNVLLHFHESTGTLLATALVVPVIAELVKPLPALTLRRFSQFGETIDGLAFGVAAGLGYAAAETIVNFSKVISTEPVHTHAASWIFPVVSVTVLTPLLQGSCTGAIAASLWARPRGRRNPLFLLGLPLALAAHVAFSLVSQVLANHDVNAAVVIGWQAVVVAVLLVFIRFVVHRALLDEGVDFGFRELICPNCRRRVAAGAFCPHCGGAVTAGPRSVAVAPAVVATGAEVGDG